MSTRADVILAIDPGRSKCGLAVVARADGDAVRVLHRAVVETPRLAECVGEAAGRFSPGLIIIGNGTSSDQALAAVSEPRLAPIEMVDEQFTSLYARKRYFAENPPRGLRRLVPLSLQTPPEAYDDYVAVVLAERYLQQ